MFLKALSHKQRLGAGSPWARVLPAALGAGPRPRLAPEDTEGGGRNRDSDSVQDPPKVAQIALHLRLVQSPQIGQSIQLTLLAQNLELAYKELKLSLSSQSVLHNGNPRPPFWQDSLYLSLGPNEGKAGSCLETGPLCPPAPT